MDEELFLRGFPFESSQIRIVPGFLAEHDELFDFPELELSHINKTLPQDFHIPELDETNALGDHDLERVEDDALSLSTGPSSSRADEQDALPDVWMLDLGFANNSAIGRLRTWEAFEKKDVPDAEKTAYLSEAGPNTFDAVLLDTQPRDADSGVLPQDVMLRALYNLALGRSSIFFQWNAAEKTFDVTLQDVPISGYSLACQSSFITKISDCGSKYRALSEYASPAVSKKRSCTALMAFKGCITSILDTVESHIATRGSTIRSILQLQGLISRPHELLVVLSRLVDSIHGQVTDEAIISALSDEVHQIVSYGNAFGETLREVLSRVSAPWLDRLCADLGLRPVSMDHPRVENETEIQEQVDDSITSFADGTLKAQPVPGFVSSSDCAVIRETKKSLQLLRQFLPANQLGMGSQTSLPDYLAHRNHANPVPPSRMEPKSSVVPINRALPTSSSFQEVESATFRLDDVGSTDENLAWAGEDVQESYFATLDTRMSQLPQHSAPDHLRSVTTSAFNGVQSTFESGSSTLPIAGEFDPLGQLRPLIRSHALHVNRTLLRHLFRNCQLRHHLDLQRQFHLFGNGDFVSRLTKALFSTDTQSAERRRGSIPTGETMGLRLGARDGQRWPPASSEIQLTLMGILTETYHPDLPNHSGKVNIKELPGGLSFSVRELPENEIEKVMDSGSIYALDFLKLQYNPPPPLDAILTATSMQAYDDVFRFVLKLIRVLHVTTKLRESLAVNKTARAQRTTASTDTGVGFAIEAHHCVSVFMSHFMDVGITTAWHKFLMALQSTEKGLDADDESEMARTDDLVGLDGLRQLHESCLSSVRNRLFLKRKQQKLRSGVEEILAAILRCASAFDSEDATDGDVEVAAFKDSVTTLLSLLHAAVETPAKDVFASKTSEEDTEAMKMLLVRLTWNDFYKDASLR